MHNGNGKQLPLQVQLQQSEDARKKLEATLKETERVLEDTHAELANANLIVVSRGNTIMELKDTLHDANDAYQELQAHFDFEMKRKDAEIAAAQAKLDAAKELPKKWRKVFTTDDGYLIYRHCADQLGEILYDKATALSAAGADAEPATVGGA